MSQNSQDETSKALSKAVYYDDDSKTPSGYIVDHSFDQYTQNLDTGFYSKVYYNPRSDSVAIVIRGSNEPLDWIENNLPMVQGKIPVQFYDANKLYYYVQKKYPNSNIEFDGHSLGASLAQLMSKYTGRPSTTFEAFGTGEIIKNHPELFNKNADITNYGNPYDPIFMSNIHKQPGTTYVAGIDDKNVSVVTAQEGAFKFKNIDPFYYHYLENTGSLDNAKLFAKDAEQAFSYEKNSDGVFKIGIKKNVYADNSNFGWATLAFGGEVKKVNPYQEINLQTDELSFLEKMGFEDMQKQYGYLGDFGGYGLRLDTRRLNTFNTDFDPIFNATGTSNSIYFDKSLSGVNSSQTFTAEASKNSTVNSEISTGMSLGSIPITFSPAGIIVAIVGFIVNWLNSLLGNR